MSRRQPYAQANYSKSWIVDGTAHRARGKPRGAGLLQSRCAGILQRRRAWSLEGARRSKPRGQRANRIAHAKLKGGRVERDLPLKCRAAFIVPADPPTAGERKSRAAAPVGRRGPERKHLNPKVQQIIVLQRGSLFRRPTIQLLLVSERQVAVRLLIRKSLLARIDGIHD